MHNTIGQYSIEWQATILTRPQMESALHGHQLGEQDCPVQLFLHVQWYSIRHVTVAVVYGKVSAAWKANQMVVLKKSR